MPRSAQQANLAAEDYKVFVSTNKSTYLFLKCQPNTRICDLQGAVATAHRTQYPEHGHVHCQRLLTSLAFRHDVQRGYAIPGTYCMSDLSFNAHIISSAQFVFRLQAELVNGQAPQESQQLHHLDTDPPLLALPVPPAQPAASTGPAATAVLQPDSADGASVQEQSAEERPKKKKKHKKRKREAEAEEEAHQAGDSEHQEDADGVTVRQRTKKRKKSTSDQQPNEEEAADAEEQQPAKKKKKRRHQSTDSADAAAEAQQQVTASEEEPEPSEAAPEQHEDSVAAADAGDAGDAAAADDAAEADATAASRKRKKKKKKRKSSAAAADAEAAATAEVAEPAEAATEAAVDEAAADDDQVADADTAVQASAEGSPGENSGQPAQSKKKKKKKKKRKSKRQEPESEGEPSQAAAEQQQAAAEAAAPVLTDGHPESSQADVDGTAATAAAEITAAQPATSGASLQTSSRKKKRAQKSLAEATAAYPGCTLPAELAGDAPTGQLAAGPSGPAQDDANAEAEPVSSSWKKKRRRELLPELDAAEDKPEENREPSNIAAGAATAADAPSGSHGDANAAAHGADVVNGHADLSPDAKQDEVPSQDVGDTTNSHGRNRACAALDMMPAIPASTSGLVSPGHTPTQQKTGYGDSSTSAESQPDNSDDEEEEVVATAPDQVLAGEEEEQEDGAQAVNGQAADAPAEAQGAVSSDSFQPSSSSDDEDAVEPQQPQEGADVHGAAGAADQGPASSDSSGEEAKSDDDEEAVQPQQAPAGVEVNGGAGAAREGSTTSSEVTDSSGDEASSESDDQAFRIQGDDFPPGIPTPGRREVRRMLDKLARTL